ncbi:hypothetical protein CAP36_04875 [Chitinophagaceae bacterium IBVUCB2]|nr:hypothetical protein CAP36_04875 [Chitinophagaceae bacterium IBVUCB2]
MKKKIPLFFLFGFLLAIQQNGLAQPFNLEERIVPKELIFEEYKKEGAEKANGRISMNQLTQDTDTAYYFIKGLSMYSPTYFSLNSSDPAADIKVHLCKENWKIFHHQGEVKGKSIYKNNFKTEGDFGIMVVANKKPAHYVLMVWTGAEMKIELPTVFKGSDGVAGSSGGGWFKKNMTLIIVAAAALLIISFLLVKLKKKKS